LKNEFARDLKILVIHMTRIDISSFKNYCKLAYIHICF